MILEQHLAGELVDDSPFFAPIQSIRIDGLLGEYRTMRQRIEQVAALFAGDVGSVVSYFIEGNRSIDGSRYSSLSAEMIFRAPKAVAALNATFWSRALSLTDVYECMPQLRRDAWNKDIREMTTPEFTEENVRATLEDLIDSRHTFFSERIDGIFRALSRSHITNRPEGFSNRQIINYMFNAYGSVDHDRGGYLHDLRAVIAKFMGRDEPNCAATHNALRAAKEAPGKWLTLDGGTLRIKAFKRGTLHLEIGEAMSWRLNAMLHSLYPTAIPASHRTPPPRRPKTFEAVRTPVAFAVLAVIDSGRIEGNTLTWASSTSKSKQVLDEAIRLLRTIGGVPTATGMIFDYPPKDALQELILSGCVPERESHQFYPTPEVLARMAIDLAEIGDTDRCLEPSAGVGGLADFMPIDRTLCIELSGLHCTVLRSKGFATACEDFLQWAAATKERFDRIVMNPPFAGTRAILHLRAAATLLSPSGRLVAVMPGSHRNREIVGGFSHHWSGPYAGSFSGADVTVAIVVLMHSPGA